MLLKGFLGAVKGEEELELAEFDPNKDVGAIELELVLDLDSNGFGFAANDGEVSP